MSFEIKTENLESVQAYPIFGGKMKSIVNERTFKCGYCLTNYVEEEDGTCEDCQVHLKELD